MKQLNCSGCGSSEFNLFVSGNVGSVTIECENCNDTVSTIQIPGMITESQIKGNQTNDENDEEDDDEGYSDHPYFNYTPDEGGDMK